MLLPPGVTAHQTKSSTQPKESSLRSGKNLDLVLMRKDEKAKQIPPREVSTEYSEAEQLASGPEAKRTQ